MDDYEQVVYYVMKGKLNELFMLMLRSDDDLLAKKVKLFLHEYHFSIDQQRMIKYYDDLMDYVKHATNKIV